MQFNDYKQKKANDADVYKFMATKEQLNFIEYVISNFIDEQFEGLGDEIKKLTDIDNSDNMPDFNDLYYHGDNLKKLGIGILCLHKIKDTMEFLKDEK